MKGVGDGGVRPGSTFREMRAKAQAGQLKGKAHPLDSAWSAPPPPAPRMAGQASGIVKKTPLNVPRTPYEKQHT